MSTSGKRRESMGSREVPASIPPPRSARRERSELDPDSLWDSGEAESEDDDADLDDAADDELDDIEETDDVALDSLDDWDHPLRGLKIN